MHLADSLALRQVLAELPHLWAGGMRDVAVFGPAQPCAAYVLAPGGCTALIPPGTRGAAGIALQPRESLRWDGSRMLGSAEEVRQDSSAARCALVV